MIAFAAMEKIDTLIEAKWIIPVEPAGVLTEHCVAVQGASILAVLPAEEARTRYAPKESITLDRHVLIPGLVNLHTRAARALLRGLGAPSRASDIPQGLLSEPERHLLSAEFVFDGTWLACNEMLRGGITCFGDTYFFPRQSAQAALECGMRAAVGLPCLDFPTAYASDLADYLAKGLETRDEFRGEPLLSFSIAPYSANAVSDESLVRAVTMSDELDLPIHVHLHATLGEIAESMNQHGLRPIERLVRLGALGPRIIAVHAAHLEPGEVEALARYGASVAHCPASDLKHAGGFAPVGLLRRAGVNVGLGTDAPPENERLDMFEQMRLCVLLAGSKQDAAFAAREALEAATLGGARALGLERVIGSIAPGKEADLCALAFDAPETIPCYDPISHLATVAGRENVSHVWVRGTLVHDKNLAGLARPDMAARVASWQNKLSAK